MTNYYGDFPEDATVYLPFNTFDSNDPSASVTATTLADSDIYVHKNGSVTDIVTDGATVVIDFDGIAGNHMITIDTSAHADYTTGGEYSVRVEGATVDAALINAWIGSFSIERAGGVLSLLKATTLASIKAETALIVADTNELQSDDVPALIASLDTVVDRVEADTQDLQTQIGTAGAGLTAIAEVGTVTDSTAQTGDTYALANGASGFAAIDADVELILADTGTDGVVVSAAQMNKIADHVIRRNSATVRASGDGDTVDDRSLLGAVSKLHNKVAVVGTDLIAYEEDDTTAFLTQALTTDAAADPITAMDTV